MSAGKIWSRNFVIINLSVIFASFTNFAYIHTSEHPGLLEEVLRKEFGFSGIILTDWVVEGAMDRRAVYPAAEPVKVAKAGGDLFMPGCKKDYQKILRALKSGELDRRQAEINATRVRRMALEWQSMRNEKAGGNT